jgi:hypothetical protein
MNCLKMEDIKLKIMDRLLQAGYFPEQQNSHVKWSKSRTDCAWFATHEIRTALNGEASAIIHRIAGAPNGNVSESHKDIYDSWFTDGYESCATAAN